MCGSMLYRILKIEGSWVDNGKGVGILHVGRDNLATRYFTLLYSAVKRGTRKNSVKEERW